MKTILLIHGPNLNLLGKRDEAHYGSLTLAELEHQVKVAAKKMGLNLKTFQSNHEGALIDWIQKKSPTAAGILINPGALTHYSYALHDALLDTRLPCIEVHLSDVQNREPWRKNSVIAAACIAIKSGQKEKSYLEALSLLHREIVAGSK